VIPRLKGLDLEHTIDIDSSVKSSISVSGEVDSGNPGSVSVVSLSNRCIFLITDVDTTRSMDMPNETVLYA
jgi:hypothetical protein